MTCQEFETQIASYMDGSLSDAESAAIEEHASTCATCEVRLEQLTLRSMVAFAPALPPTMREQALSAVAARRESENTKLNARVHESGVRPMRWVVAATAVAAAAVLMIVVRPREKQEQRVYADSSKAAALVDTATSAGMADERARPEFSALDDAARELRAALVATPDDAQLREFLATVNARRGELERRVKDARS